MTEQEVEGVGEGAADGGHHDERHDLDLAGQEQVAVAGLERDEQERVLGRQRGGERGGDRRSDAEHDDRCDQKRDARLAPLVAFVGRWHPFLVGFVGQGPRPYGLQLPAETGVLGFDMAVAEDPVEEVADRRRGPVGDALNGREGIPRRLPEGLQYARPPASNVDGDDGDGGENQKEQQEAMTGRAPINGHGSGYG